MKKNQNPYSEPRNLRIVPVSQLANFSTIRSRFIGSLKPDAQWETIDIVPGTLNPSCVQNDAGFYNVEITFRVSFEVPENQQHLESLKFEKLVARYTSSGNQEKVAGTMSFPLELQITSSPGFDGYECRLFGIQDKMEAFI